MRERQSGFTLVELMVAMAIGIILMTGLIQILLANRQAYRVMEGANFMQENMRFSVERLAYAARMAAHRGNVRNSSISGASVPGADPACSAGWTAAIGRPIEAWNGAATAPAALANCFDAAQYEPNTDVVVMRYIEADPEPPGAVLDAGRRYMLASTLPQSGQLFQGSSGLPVIPVTNTGELARPQNRVYPYTVEMFWVRRCNDPGLDGICGNADDGDFDNPIPTLMRGYVDATGVWTSEPVADGAEQLQFEFQLGRGNWLSSEQVTTGGILWSQISNLRVSGIARSAERDNSFPADTRTFPLSGDTPSHSPTGIAARTLRTRFESTVAIRNRYRGV